MYPLWNVSGWNLNEGNVLPDAVRMDMKMTFLKVCFN